MQRQYAIGPAAVLLGAMLACPPVGAVTQTRISTTAGARMCALSTPTIDTSVRAKATGFVNEGTASAFVICVFDSAPGQKHSPGTVAAADDTSSISLYFNSIDGQSHSFSCTAVNSWTSQGFSAPMQYITKTVSWPAGAFQEVWTAADFGGTTIPASGVLSITCALPPQVSIMFGSAGSQEDVGS